MSNLLMSEVRRALHRRVVWVLVLVGLVGIAILGVVAFVDSAGKSVADLTAEGTHPAVIAGWWVPGGGEGILIIAAMPLALGAVIGGASVVGAEWRAGTVTTVLTWEPRRVRVHVARMAASFVLATVIAFVMQAIFLAAFLPAVVAHGSAAGTDAQWWFALVAAMGRIALLTGVAAVLAGSLATIGRSAVFAMGATFVWMAVVEPLVRGWKPRLAPHLIGENLTIVLTWAQLDTETFTRPELLAMLVLGVYCGAIAVIAAVSFVRRDIAGTS
jgi:hypothetical protein